MTVINVGMLLGALIWLGFELYGAFGRKAGGDTTSEFWWGVQRRFPIGARIVLVLFLLWLSTHLLFGVLPT